MSATHPVSRGLHASGIRLPIYDLDSDEEDSAPYLRRGDRHL